MASITIRQLDDDLKKRLRLRAARNGRSMEEEARIILGHAAAGRDGGATKRSAPRAASRRSGLQPIICPSPVPGSKHVLLIIGGGIAAYKSLDLIRRLKERGLAVRCILTEAAQEFITPLSAAALSGERVFTDLFDATTELDVGHIRLAREADLVVVAPATADLMAKMAGGLASDLAAAVLLATDRTVLLAPAMNPQMWAHPATRRNLARLLDDGIAVIGPNAGEMAESGEAGIGRMAEPLEIVAAALPLLDDAGGDKPLAGQHVIVTSGPTHEPIDPVRYIANRSSGKQGHAIAAAAAAAGAKVTLVSGPVNVPDPAGVKVVKVETAQEMLAAVTQSAARRRRRVRRGGRGLARGQAEREQDQEAGRRLSEARARRESRHPRDCRAQDRRAAAPGHRLRRRDRSHHRPREGKACAQRLRLDRRQRCVGRVRRHGRRSQHRPSRHRAGGRILAAAVEGRGGARARRPHCRNARGSRAVSKIQVQVMRLPHGSDLPIPAYQSELAAGLDLVAAVPAEAPVIIAPGQRAIIPTGIAIALPPGIEGQIRPRSGLALRHGVTVLNSPGTVDADYRGEVRVILVNFGHDSFTVERGARIAQLVLAATMQAVICEVANLDETTRGVRGLVLRTREGKGRPTSSSVE